MCVCLCVYMCVCVLNNEEHATYLMSWRAVWRAHTKSSLLSLYITTWLAPCATCGGLKGEQASNNSTNSRQSKCTSLIPFCARLLSVSMLFFCLPFPRGRIWSAEWRSESDSNLLKRVTKLAQFSWAPNSINAKHSSHKSSAHQV